MANNPGNPKKVPIKLRVLWHSVAPWIATGYGKVTRQICTRLPKYGFQTVISAYYGLEPGGLLPYQIPVLPSKDGPFGVGSAAQYCKQYGIDVGILFADWWAFKDFPKVIPKATAYTPMDQVSYSEEIMKLTREYYKIIALCKWQQKHLANASLQSDCIYHGVDTRIFKSIDKKEAKKKIGVTKEDVFIFLGP